jgi:hypothetical protein
MKPSLIPSPLRGGSTIVETLVAFGLLITVMSVTASLTVRNQRLLSDNRAYRLAVEELSNRLELLTTMPAEEATAAIEACDEEILTGSLAGARLTGVVETEDYGRRLTLTLAWSSGVKRRPDISLSAWSFAESDKPETQP